MKKARGKADIELFRTDPGRFIEGAITEYARTSPINRLVTFGNAPIYDEPLVSFARGDDPIFQELKTIIGEFHLTPREMMDKYTQAKGWRYGTRNTADLSVISWAMPIPLATRLSERQASWGGSTRYNHTRWVGGRFHDSLANYVCSLLEILGFNAVSPSHSRFFETANMPGGWRAANWSERHIAYACGLGTFGLNGLMITSRGCSVYLGSAVCDIALPPTPRHPSHTGNCLYYRDGSCWRCIERCMAGAISEQGRSNMLCRDNLVKTQFDRLRELGLDKDLLGMAPSCGLCSNGVPCEDRIPDSPDQ